MKAALRAEARKLRYQRSTWGILISAMAIAAVSTVSIIATTQMPESRMALPLTLEPTIRLVMASATGGYIFALVLGIVISTTEFRHSTAVATYLAQPDRGTVMVAKMVAGASMGVVVQLVSTVVGWAAGLAYLTRYDHATLPGSAYVEILAGSLLVGAVLAVMGVAVGSLLRSQMIAVVGALLWLQLIEALIVVFADWMTRWSITGAINSVLSIAVETPEFSLTAEDVFTPWQSVGLLLVYAAVLGLVALRTSMRRDVD